MSGPGARIADEGGRQVLLRGVNVNQLGEYYQANPAFPAVVPLGRGDFDQIAALGLNSVRLIVSWSALEPQPGAFDRRYLRRVGQAVRWARKNDLYVILDMHQDAWGPHVDTEPGETCPAGTQPAVGWDGAPEWATLTDGASTCRASLRELTPAVVAAWDSFYADRQGIQSALIATWARLAARFGGDPAIAGYDLLNEPNPGHAFGRRAADLGRFYGRLISAIREAEDGVRYGFHHIAFFEPGIEWSAFATTETPPPDFTPDRNIVFAPHLYADSITIAPVSVEQGFEYAAQSAGRYGTTFWSGEWGWFGDSATDAAEIARYAAQEDARLVGGAWWSWKQACGDPHVTGLPGGQPNPISPSLNRYACPSQQNLGIPETTRRILSRATVHAAPGVIGALASDPATGAFEASGPGSSPAGEANCEIAAWVPGSARPSLRSSGIRHLKARPVAGGWAVSGCARGEWSLSRSG